MAFSVEHLLCAGRSPRGPGQSRGFQESNKTGGGSVAGRGGGRQAAGDLHTHTCMDTHKGYARVHKHKQAKSKYRAAWTSGDRDPHLKKRTIRTASNGANKGRGAGDGGACACSCKPQNYILKMC